MTDYQSIIDKYYPLGTKLREIYLKHAIQVSEKALAIASRCNIDIAPNEIITAAMLHDIGIFDTDASGIECHGKHPYLAHGIIGAELLRREGIPEIYARVAERHTGAGITVEDIRRQNMPIPERDYCPETTLEKLICYADKFYSKSGAMQEKSIAKIRASMSRFSPGTLARFDALHKLFS